MAIASAIIAGVLGTASLVAGVAGSKAAEEEQEKALSESREFQAGEAEKDRRIQQRQQRQKGFDMLAQQRMGAQQMSTQRSFNKNALAGMRLAMQRKGQQAPQAPQAGLPTTTFGRAA